MKTFQNNTGCNFKPICSDRKPLRLILSLFFVLIVFNIHGATYYSIASGNWNSNSTWSNTSGGSAASAYPVAGDVVYIERGYTVTVNTNSACSSVQLGWSLNSLSIMSFSSGVTLTVSGSVTLGRSSNNNRRGHLNMSSGGTLICSSLILGNTGTNQFTPGSGTIQLTGNNTLPASDIFAVFNNLSVTSGTTSANWDHDISGNLSVSNGAGFTLLADVWLDLAGNLTNAGTLTLNAGGTFDTYLFIGGNLTNTGTISATANYTGLYFDGTSTQSFNNTGGTVTAPLTSLTLDNANGLTVTGNTVAVTRLNLFTGALTPTSLILGNGGTTYATVQRGSNNLTTAVGSFSSAPTFNIGSEGLYVLYDEGSLAYSTGYEIPSSGNVHTVVMYDDADVTLSGNMTISNELEFYDFTSKLRIGANTLTLDGVISYTEYGEFYGGTTSNLIMGGTSDLDKVINGIDDFTVKSTASTTMISDQTFHDDVLLQGTLTIAGFNFNIGGDWTNNGGTLIHTEDNSVATITFCGSGDQYINGTAATQSFYNLKIRNSGGTVTTSGSTTTLNCKNLSVIQGTFTSPATLTIDGTLIKTGGTYNAGTTTNVDGHYFNFGGTFNNNSGNFNFTNDTVAQFLVGTTTFHNMSTEIAGAHNLDAGMLYKTGFEGGNAYDWLKIDVTGSSGDVYIVNNGLNPACSPSEGTSMIEFNSYTATNGHQTRAFLSVPISTFGRNTISVLFDWYEDAAYSTYNDRVTVQYSTDGDTWTDVTTYSRYNATTGWKNKTCALPLGAENQVELYIGFLFTSAFGNNCHLDNVRVTCLPATPSVVTVNNDFNITKGTYGIGSHNTLAINDTIIGNTPLTGGTTCNFKVGGTASNLIMPVITNGLSDLSITRPNGATLRYDRSLTVLDSIKNSVGVNGLIIQSNALGTGSLLHYQDTIRATIQRYTTGSTDTTLMLYHCVSIPMDESNNSQSGLFYQSYLFYFSEDTNDWIGLGAPTGTGLDERRGYLIYYVFNNDTTYQFPGVMKAGSFSPLVRSHVTGPTDEDHGWNLVPNPYPSAIDWYAASGWTKTNIDNSIYIWNPSAGDYASYGGGTPQNGGSRYIQVGQSFFIHANTTTPTFSMNNSVRLHNSTAFLKNMSDTVINELRLQATNKNGFTNELVVKFNEYATEYFDSDWDAYNLAGLDDVPDISTVSSDQIELSINTLPFSAGERIVPVKLHNKHAGEISFVASGMESFTMMPPIYLEDKVLDKIVDLSQDPVYVFDFQPGQEDRFNLIFNNITANDVPENNNWLIFHDKGKIKVHIPQLEGLKAAISVYDMAGRSISDHTVVMNGMVQVDAPRQSGVYLVTAVSGKDIFTRKLIIL